jgi:zinc/manganese transport system ATP-binding protein
MKIIAICKEGGAVIDDAAAAVVRDLVAAHGRRIVLRGITARFPRARVTAVVGPNGAGKSTLLDVLAGVRAPASGSVERPVGRSAPAYVVQRSAVADALPITVREAVAMGRWARRGPWRRLTAADRAVVDTCLDRLGIADLASRALGELSGGQRQRALVAQGLAQESDLLLLDEPAAALDLAAQARIDKAVAHACATGVTVVRVTHDLRVAERADHCLLLHDGRLIGDGPPQALLSPAAIGAAWSLPVLPAT